MRASEFVVEKKKRKRKPRWAAYGPGMYGGYGYYAGYSGDSGDGGGDGGGGGESIENEDAMMGKIEDGGKIVRILKKAHTVPFSDEKNWLLIDTDPAKGNKGLGLKWVPASTRFEWVRPYRDTMDENFADGKNPGRKGLAKRSGVNTKASVSSLRKTAKNSSGEKARMAHWMANMKAGRAKKNKQHTMKIREILESATAGATSAGNVAVGAVYKNRPGKTPKNRDGTAKNALDLKGVGLLTGGSLVKR